MQNGHQGPKASLLLVGMICCLPLFVSEALVSKSTFTHLESAAKELARSARSSDLFALLQILRSLGFPESALEKLEKGCLATLEKNKTQASSCPKAVEKLRSAVKSILPQLEKEPDPERRARLAELLLQLDGSQELAHRTLGHQLQDSTWILPEHAPLLARRVEWENALREARRLSINLEITKSDHAHFNEVTGGGLMTGIGGITIHCTRSADRFERIVREVMRAIAFSRYVREGKLEIPNNFQQFSKVLLLLDSKVQFLKSLELSLAAKAITNEEAEESKETGGYKDNRGFAVLYEASEVDQYGALFHDLTWPWRWEELSGNVQPCLSVGHLNWVALRCFGVPQAEIAVNVTTTPSADKSSQTVSQGQLDLEREEAHRAADAGIVGARSWLEFLVRHGEDPHFESAMQKQMGEVTGHARLKATFMVEFLQERGEFSKLCKETLIKSSKAAANANARDSFEKSLGMKLEELELQWREWFLEREPGLLERLGESAQELSADEKEALALLQDVRSSAWKAEFFGELRPVTLDPSLSDGCRQHGRYLQLHPQQAEAWPDAHEEYPDQKGFTTEGCHAGMHSVIAPGSGSARDAMDGWMSTYFHRLPLLDPGLIRIGWGMEFGYAVMDSGSLVAPTNLGGWIVWPPDQMRNVPLRFSPEAPNPVPGENQSSWGYPITLQSYGAEAHYEMQLFVGTNVKDSPVPCHFTHPSKPLNPDLAPKNAFCLIPKAPLKPNTLYTVRASREGVEPLSWSFTTGS